MLFATDQKGYVMHIEKLRKPPLSGEYDEKYFGNIVVNPLWIKFHPDEDDCWVGSFDDCYPERNEW